MKKHKHNLTEGLRHKDLRDQVSDIFTIDQYKSKMGEDRDVVVLGFRVKEKYPAIDLMEFIEKGYPFILDSDISSGEENDGQYQVFVEIERTTRLPSQIEHLLKGISQLCDCIDWRFKYQKSRKIYECNPQTISEHVPMSPIDYEKKILEIRTHALQEFFNRGITDVALESDGSVSFSRPYSGKLRARLVAMGKYRDIEKTLEGPLSLDENSSSEILFLNKFLGDYEIHKIGNNFIIRNDNKAVVIEKDTW